MTKAKKDAVKFINGVPRGLEIVNTGSTFSMYGFDYKYFGKKGFNFAMAPQPLEYDLKILEQYSGHIEGNAVVVVVVCPFGFCVDNYVDDESSYKYYFFLDKGKINNYNKVKEYVIKHVPILLPLRKPVVLMKSLIKKLIGYDKKYTMDDNTPENVNKTAKARISVW
jgi:hypothetical protein